MQKFDQIFEEIYEPKFIDKFLEEAVSIIEHDKFVGKIKPEKKLFAMFVKDDHEDRLETMGDGQCDWLFSP